MDGLDLHPLNPNIRWIGLDHPRHDEMLFLVDWYDRCPLAEQEFFRAQRIFPGQNDLRGTGCWVARLGHGNNDTFGLLRLHLRLRAKVDDVAFLRLLQKTGSSSLRRLGRLWMERTQRLRS